MATRDEAVDDLATALPPAPPRPRGTVDLGSDVPPSALTGTWEQSIDDKSRFAVPVEVRRAFGAGGVLRASQAGCVVLHRTEAFADQTARLQRTIAEALDAAGGWHEDERVGNAEDLLRLHTAGTAAVAWDETGRISLRADLRDSAGIVASSRDDRRFVLVAGMGERAEVWEPGRYTRHIVERQAAFKQRAAARGRS